MGNCLKKSFLRTLYSLMFAMIALLPFSQREEAIADPVNEPQVKAEEKVFPAFAQQQDAPKVPPQAPPAEVKNLSAWKIDAKLYTPADVSRACAADASALANVLPPEEMLNIRYLSLANTPKAQRKLYAGRLNMLLHSLSRKRGIGPLFLGGPDTIFVRINLADYGIDPFAYGNLAESDPYFHEQVTLVQGKETRKDVASAVWLDPQAMTSLIALLQTRAPLLRADWFIVTASLPPHYYNLLGLKTLNDVKDLALFDPRSEKLTLAKATVVFSGERATKVARNNRILWRISTATGAWWQTQDFKTSIGEKNVIHNFLNETFDGSEIIFTLPNGMQGYFLVNGKNERVDEVPIDIAYDSLNEDRRVRNGRSCIGCHTKGIQPFASDSQVASWAGQGGPWHSRQRPGKVRPSGQKDQGDFRRARILWYPGGRSGEVRDGHQDRLGPVGAIERGLVSAAAR